MEFELKKIYFYVNEAGATVFIVFCVDRIGSLTYRRVGFQYPGEEPRHSTVWKEPISVHMLERRVDRGEVDTVQLLTDPSLKDRIRELTPKAFEF